jgi:hypothetical protein
MISILEDKNDLGGGGVRLEPGAFLVMDVVLLRLLVDSCNNQIVMFRHIDRMYYLPSSLLYHDPNRILPGTALNRVAVNFTSNLFEKLRSAQA